MREKAESLLEPGETVAAWFEPDLDAGMRYAAALVVLTDRRLWTLGAETQSWPLKAIETLRAREHAGAGCLEMFGPGERLSLWRYTLRSAAAARHLVESFERLRRSNDLDAEIGTATCPSCGLPFPADQSECPACVVAQTKTPVSALFRLFGFAWSRAGMVILGFLLTLCGTAASLVPPYLTMPLLDKVLIPYQTGAPADFGLAKWYLLGLGGASVLAWGLGWGRTYVMAWVSERIAADLRHRTYEHLQCLSVEFFGSKRTGDLLSRVSSDTDRICYFLSVYLLDFGTDVLMLGMTAAILLSIDVWLALVTLVPLPIIAWLVYRVRNRLRRGFALGTRAWGDMTSVLADTIPGIRVVKAFAQEHREVERFRRANDRVLQANDRVNRVWAFFGPAVVLLTDLGLLVIWIFGVWQVYHHHVTVGVLTAFVAYISRFYSRMDSMSRMASAVQRAGASAQRVFAILDRNPSVPEPVRPVHPGRIRGEVEIRGVGFRYGSRPILQDVSLSIRPGEMIGLVGPSGAGKSTLVNLVCRFYDVTDGAVLVDGVDIRSFPVHEYRQNIGIVLQEPFLFYGTIAENIAYGRPDARREEIVAAARAARAHEFILRLGNGYDSLVGERGQSLSGGERQRISIARALLIDPRILILDEATSSVDPETEREIQLALENLVSGRTTIAIAHRLSTLRRADRLVVLERGEITETGQHDELLETPGTYARLYHAQLEMAEGRAISAGEA